ncbi:MAG: hypothetical protein ACKESB_02765 [Candidatus Hodgkinia cicadicola]
MSWVRFVISGQFKQVVVEHISGFKSQGVKTAGGSGKGEEEGRGAFDSLRGHSLVQIGEFGDRL